MNWITSFEILCYIITAMFLIDVIFKKTFDELWLFISATFAGFALELLAVRVTGIYHYSKDFLISIGFEPYQFPFFGGLMWGGLAVYSLRIARKLNAGSLMTSLIAGWLIVTMDLFLDVVAIRLNGGFWVWDGREITLNISHHMFMSVIWVNFLGYLFETPAVVFFHLKTWKRRSVYPWWKQLLISLGIGLVGILFVGISSGISLGLNMITDEWFSYLAFILLWGFIFISIIRLLHKGHYSLNTPAKADIPVIVFYSALYLFCICALWYLGIAKAVPIYFAGCIAFYIFTVLLAAKNNNTDKSVAHT